MVVSLRGIALALLASSSPALTAQGLELRVLGGSYPGPLELAVEPGATGQYAIVILSSFAGPTPLSLLDPTDPRILDVGIESIGSAIAGPFFVGGRFQPPALQLPNDPGFLDATIHWQAISVPGLTRFVDQVSQARVTRFAPANSFRDRLNGLNTARAFFPAVALPDGRWAALGGGLGGLLAQIATRFTEIYQPATDTFVNGTDMTTERSLHTATRLQDGRHLLVAGVDLNNDPQVSCEIFDPVHYTFTAVAPMRDPRMGHSATLLPNGRVLVAGGLSDLNMPVSALDPINSALSSTEIYDPVQNTWTVGPAMNAPRAGHAAIVLPDGRVLLAGGIGWIRILIKIPTIFDACDIYDPATNTISRGPAMATPRAIFPTAAVTAGVTMVSGGISSIVNLGTPTALAESYDATTNRWTSAGSMQQARGLHTVFPLGGTRWLLLGGADGAITSPDAIATTEVYDHATRSFTAGPPMSMSRAAFGDFRTPTGQLHLIGGGTGTGARATNTTDWYFR